MGVADDPADAGERFEVGGTPLGVAAGSDNHGVRLLAPGPTYRSAGVGIPGTRYRAGVDDVDVCRFTEGHHLVPLILKSGTEGFGLVLIELAAKMLHRHAQRGCGNALLLWRFVRGLGDSCQCGPKRLWQKEMKERPEKLHGTSA